MRFRKKSRLSSYRRSVIAGGAEGLTLTVTDTGLKTTGAGNLAQADASALFGFAPVVAEPAPVTPAAAFSSTALDGNIYPSMMSSNGNSENPPMQFTAQALQPPTGRQQASTVGADLGITPEMSSAPPAPAGPSGQQQGKPAPLPAQIDFEGQTWCPAEVETGDTLASLAPRYGVPAQAIVAANGVAWGVEEINAWVIRRGGTWLPQPVNQAPVPGSPTGGWAVFRTGSSILLPCAQPRSSGTGVGGVVAAGLLAGLLAAAAAYARRRRR